MRKTVRESSGKKEKEKVQTYTFTMSSHERQKLKKISLKTKRSMSDIAREALAALFEEEKYKKILKRVKIKC